MSVCLGLIRVPFLSVCNLNALSMLIIDSRLPVSVTRVSTIFQKRHRICIYDSGSASSPVHTAALIAARFTE